jgi:Domain of unknown function (DUF4396)
MALSLLHGFSILMLVGGATCAVIIAADEYRHPQRMAIMNVVWPITGLYAAPFALWGYFTYGRLAVRDGPARGQATHATETPFAAKVGKGAAHCGAGCTLGDICAECLAFFVPAVAGWAGYATIFQDKIFAVWIIDFVFAFAFGIVFQYFTIKPMRDLSVVGGLTAALKADVLSLTAWQVGMYGFMAVAHFWIFRRLLGIELRVASPEFWFMMQIAMLAGFGTAYPVNWWLVRSGIKEAM